MNFHVAILLATLVACQAHVDEDLFWMPPETEPPARIDAAGGVKQLNFHDSSVCRLDKRAAYSVRMITWASESGFFVVYDSGDFEFTTGSGSVTVGQRFIGLRSDDGNECLIVVFRCEQDDTTPTGYVSQSRYAISESTIAPLEIDDGLAKADLNEALDVWKSCYAKKAR